MSVRCFIAVEVDDPSTLDGIAKAQSSLNSTGAHLKLVERENLHLTLKFLGDVREGLLPEVAKAVSETSFRPFRMALRGVGVFPNLRRPRVIWAGITEGVEELTAIFRDLEPRLVDLDFKPESRPFSPHITIARVRSGRNRDRLIEEVLNIWIEKRIAVADEKMQKAQEAAHRATERLRGEKNFALKLIEKVRKK